MELSKYQELASKTAVFPKDIGLAYCVLGLNGEAGEVAEKLKKIFRDNNGIIDNKNKDEIAKECGDVLWYLSQICEILELNLDNVAQMNIDKLNSRMQRNKLQGSGDNR